ncbi:hypothetical protein DRQ26_00535 [bacterium]|nr:MAG: hypothetical protein DRQ26_00535 [bacterium]
MNVFFKLQGGGETTPFYFTINNTSWKGYVAPISASTERWLELVGGDHLVDGVCRIDLPQDFLESTTIDEDNPIRIFITPTALIGNYWVEKHRTYFIIHSQQDGTFDYKVHAKIFGSENKKLEKVDLTDYNIEEKHPENKGR